MSMIAAMVTSMSVKPDPASVRAWSMWRARARLLHVLEAFGPGRNFINYAANPPSGDSGLSTLPGRGTNGNSPLAYRRVAAIGHEGLAVPF